VAEKETRAALPTQDRFPPATLKPLERQQVVLPPAERQPTAVAPPELAQALATGGEQLRRLQAAAHEVRVGLLALEGAATLECENWVTAAREEQVPLEVSRAGAGVCCP
jgi:hypothetical protein